MDRRGFLKGLFAASVAVAACAKPPGAEAATLPDVPAPSPETLDEAARASRALDDAGAGDGVETKGQFYIRRVYYRPRRYYYRPRRVYYRPRRVYYRPRRVYYRPRRVYIRRFYW